MTGRTNLDAGSGLGNERRGRLTGVLRRLHRQERGVSLIFVGMGFLALMSASMLAIDVGMIATARSQAQNAADAGALAGATALVFDDYTNRSASGPAVQNAIEGGKANLVMAQQVSIVPDDVTFPNDPQGLPNRVQVIVHRTGARGNPLTNFIGPFFGHNFTDVTATATAEASPANAATCIKPWAVPDKWWEEQTPPWDPDDTFDLYKKKGQLLPNPDEYVPVTQSGYTGYNSNPAGPDYGLQVLLKAGNPHQAINSSHFFPIALPPDNGASWYEQNIPGCWPGIMRIGDMIPVEPGNMTGPTVSGTQQLIDKDPGAYWDNVNRRVVSSMNPSPRIIVIPVFDPYVYEEGRESGRLDIKVANLLGFFVEGLQSNGVLGRVVPTTGLIRGTVGGPVPGGAFLRAIRLVQ
jgi:Flp pilus assembly protein TadG